MRLVITAATLAIAVAPVPAAADPPDCALNLLGCGTGVAATETHFEGAIIVPGSEAANREVARSGGCVGCEWTLVRRCDLNTPIDPGQANCLGARCPGEG